MKKLLSLFTLIAFTTVLYGQRTSGYKKNSVGLDLVPIMQNAVHSDSLIPYGVTYRRFIAPNHAVRLRVDGGYIEDINKRNGPYEVKRWALGFAAGYQYTVPLTEWADVLFALDVGYLWKQKKLRDILHTDIEDKPWMRINVNENHEHWRVAVAPTVELQLKWTQRISFGLAVSPQYAYRYNFAERSYYYYSDMTREVYSRGWSLLSKNSKYAIIPTGNIFLLYNF